MVKKLRADEGGITPVLGAMFILGIVIALSSAFLATWGPSEMNRRAREHMQEVNESFRELRAVIEGLRVGESKTVSIRMGPDPVPFIPSPGVGGTLSVMPPESEVRAYSQRIYRIPGENVIYPLQFEIWPGELEAYDWYIIATTGENKERIESVFFCVNHDNFDDWDYYYTPASQGPESTFPKTHGGMENDLPPGRVHEGRNYINVLVESGGAGAWVEVNVVRVPACARWENVNFENGKFEPGHFKFTIENQGWVYEMGMVILIQGNVVLMDSAPHMVTVWEAGGNDIGVYVDVIKVRGLESSMSGTGISSVTVSILRRFEKKENRESATIRINSNYGNAWREYLASENQRLNAKGYGASFDEDKLTLTIRGKDNTPGVKDIIYYQKVTEIWVSIT
jgi:hypothetical protein